MTSADYAVIYSDSRGTYQVQLFKAEDVPLAVLKEKAEKFNNNKYGRKAVVIHDPNIINAFCFFHDGQKRLCSRMKKVENALYKLEDDVRLSSFIQLATFNRGEESKI